ncbi:monocarboxylate transporter 5-like [Argonauta hians]
MKGKSGGKMSGGSKEESGTEIEVQGDHQVVFTDPRPLDRGWAWVILAGFAAMNCLAKFFSLRTFALFGCCLCSLTFVLDSVTRDIFVFPFIHILNGTGIAVIYGSCIVVQSTYFSRYLGTANAISACGVSIGQFTLPYLLNYLIETFGVRGALLLNGGIYLQCFVFAALLRPMSYYDAKPPSKKVKQTDIELNERNVPTDIDTQQIESSKLLSDHGRDIYPSLSDKDNITAMESNHSVVESSVREPLNSSGEDRETGVENIDINTHYPKEKSPGKRKDGTKTKNKKDKKSSQPLMEGCRQNLRKLLAAPDFSLFKQKIFIFGYIGVMLGSAVSSMPQTFFPAHSIDLGLTSSDGVFFLTVSGAADFAGRILVILLADRKFLNRARFLGIVLIIHGIAACFITYYTKFYLFAIYCACYGVVGGIHFSISNTVMVDFIGASKMSEAVGLIILGSGIVGTVGYPFMGYLRDVTGSYNIAFIINGVGLLISGAMFLAEPFISYTKHI